MSTIQVSECIVIRENIDDIFPFFSELKNWDKWSPWFVSDPTATFELAEDNGSAKWKGRSIGEGEIKILSVNENKSVEIEIRIALPQKLNAKASIKFDRSSFGTLVMCHYEEKAAFLKTFVNKTRSAEIAFDIKRGLRMVECLVQKGSLNSDLKMIGVQKRFGYDYVGIRREVSIDRMQAKVLKDFERLIPYSASNIPERDRPWPFIIYHNWNKETFEVSFTSCVSVLEIPKSIPHGMVLGKTEDARVFAVNHKGGHRHITNAYRSLHYLEKADLIDVNKNKGYVAMEYFHDGPLNIPLEKINSDFIFPLNEVDIMSKKVYLDR